MKKFKNKDQVLKEALVYFKDYELAFTFGCFMDGHFNYYAELKDGRIMEFNFFLKNGESICKEESISNLIESANWGKWRELVIKEDWEDLMECSVDLGLYMKD
jgi:hypothetical protein